MKLQLFCLTYPRYTLYMFHCQMRADRDHCVYCCFETTHWVFWALSLCLSLCPGMSESCVCLQVLLIGESGVGKSTLVGRLCEDRFMPEHRQYTLGEALSTFTLGLLIKRRGSEHIYWACTKPRPKKHLSSSFEYRGCSKCESWTIYNVFRRSSRISLPISW